METIIPPNNKDKSSVEDVQKEQKDEDSLKNEEKDVEIPINIGDKENDLKWKVVEEDVKAMCESIDTLKESLKNFLSM